MMNQNYNMQGNNGMPNQQPGYQGQPMGQPMYQQPPMGQPMYQQPVYPGQPMYAQPQKKGGCGKIILIVVIIFVLFIAIIFGIAFYIAANSNQLVCTSEQGEIIILYDDEGLTGYSTSGSLTYDYEGQKEKAKEMGVNEYINQFKSYFESNYSGTCTQKNKK